MTSKTEIDTCEDCPHIKIGRCTEGGPDDAPNYVDMWVCEGCGMEFKTIEDYSDLQTEAEQTIARELSEATRITAQALDMMAGTFGAVLADLQDRVFTKYGVAPSPEFDMNAPDPQEQVEAERRAHVKAVLADDCEAGNHQFAGGTVCIGCGAPMFMGSGG